MAHRCVRKFRLAKPTIRDVRHLHSTPPHYDALALPQALAEPPAASSGSSSTRKSPLDALRRQKTEDLRNLLSLRIPSPGRVWGSYLELLQFYGSTKVPLDIHQGVLRKCALPPEHVRAAAAKWLARGRRYKQDVVFESRFQRVFRNIRSAGDFPTLEDYHCVLELFAAVGNHKGSMMVLTEIERMELAKNPQTYALCLHTLCHRLTLPIWHRDRPVLVDEVTEHCTAILNEMEDKGVPYTPLHVDLAFRIMKETMGMDAFATLMRNAYGIDLAYPDRSPLAYWGKLRDAAVVAEGQDDLPAKFPAQLPFTIAAFNTALDYLARAGDVSKLVQTFEVMTTPLPTAASNSNAFEDDDDDDFGVSNPQVAPYKPPHVQPNTSSYCTLLRGVCNARHAVLARHYILVFTSQEREYNAQLLEMVRTRPQDEIPSPRLLISRSVLLPVFSLANRDKNTELLRWINNWIKRAISWHRADIDAFTEARARWIEEGVYRPSETVGRDLEENVNDLPSVAPSSQFASFFSPSSSSREPSSAFDPSSPTLADPTASASQPVKQRKAFDVDLHLSLLEREVIRLEDMERRADAVLARNSQRIKERLGRRVWGGKDIYLRNEDARRAVSRERWREIVNFRPPAEVEAQVRLLAEESAHTAKRREWRSSATLRPGEQGRMLGPEDQDEPPHKSSGSRWA
ncbi:hypothetical protein GSI_00473 [Ganoderma sinense ZZ0214-1]|uniref:Uncharacterized protein n=1 Tax=Ganoderma sinense ZZ0214-1 TaxID=1077348 RepID=A0A2G8SSV5_9APHY|nr:hypothetical protein GSI_00473 [Ganoderma sinense ZZ0214-1]